MEPAITPLETVDTPAAHRLAGAEQTVTAAWVDHHEELYAFLLRTTRDPEAAEDLLQEAFTRLTFEVRRGLGPDNVRAWLYRVAANLAVSRGRRLSAAMRGMLRLGTSSSRTDATPEASFLEREGQNTLLAALAHVSPDGRAALLLSAEGFTGAEIAHAIGRSELATRTLLCRARATARGRLERTEAVR